MRDHLAMSVADTYLVELGAPADGCDREAVAQLKACIRDLPALIREEELLRVAAQPLMRFAVKLAVGLSPGTGAPEDADWAATAALARRQTVVHREADIDGGLADLNLGLLDWIDSKVGGADDRDFVSLVRARVDGLLDAGRRGSRRGAELRAAREAQQTYIAPVIDPAGWLLRHPGDHYFRLARSATSDVRLAELLDAQVALLAKSYDRLAADYRADAPADLVVELSVRTPAGLGGTEPVSATVEAVDTGPVSVGDQIVLRLVADPAAPFNGTLISVRGGERWLTRAHRVRDGTIVPRDGTRRIAA